MLYRRATTTALVLLATCNRDEPAGSSHGSPSLLCDVPSAPLLRARYDPEVTPVECDPLAFAPHPTTLESPAVAGQSRDGSILMMDRLTSLSPRFFAKEAGSVLERVDAVPVTFQSDGDRWVLEFSAAGSFFSAGTLDAPLVPRSDRLEPDFAQSTIDLQFETSSGTRASERERLAGIDDCEALTVDLPPNDEWWTVEYLAESPSTGVWLYLIGLGDLGGDASSQRYFVFHGPLDAVRQRALTSFARTRDGRTTFSYDVDGELVQVEFPGSCDAHRVSRLCPGTMSLSNEEYDLESRWSEFPDALTELSFYCQYIIDSQ